MARSAPEGPSHIDAAFRLAGGLDVQRSFTHMSTQTRAEVEYELIVIGAGINGAAIAREAAVAGFKVLIVERGDIG